MSITIDNESKEILRQISEDFIFFMDTAPCAYHIGTGHKMGKESMAIYCAKHYGDVVGTVTDAEGKEKAFRQSSGKVWWDWEGEERRVARDVVMQPTNAGEDYGSPVFNRWYVLKQEMCEPDYTATTDSINILLRHLMYISDGNMLGVAYLLNWSAQLYQFPDVKIPGANLMYSKFGRVGKSMLFHLYKQVFGKPLVGTCNGSALSKAFDDAMEHKRIMFINEMARSEKEDGYERFKNMISEDTVTFEGKGRAAKEVANLVHYIVTTNKSDALPLMESDGRINVLRCTSVRKADAYYKELADWIEGPGPSLFAGVLATWKFPKDWDPYAPVPQTEATRLMQRESRGSLVLLIEELIEENRPPFDKDVGRVLDLNLQLETLYGQAIKGMRLNNKTLPMALERIAAVQLPTINYKDNKGNAKTSRVWCWRNQEEWAKATGQEVADAMGLPQL